MIAGGRRDDAGCVRRSSAGRRRTTCMPGISGELSTAEYGTLACTSKNSHTAAQKPATSLTDHCHRSAYDWNGPLPRSLEPADEPADVGAGNGLGRRCPQVFGGHGHDRGLDQRSLRRQARHPIGDQRGVPIDELGQARSSQVQAEVDHVEAAGRAEREFERGSFERPRPNRSVAGLRAARSRTRRCRGVANRRR